jgi:Zn-finger nucleic acid-binding protein
MTPVICPMPTKRRKHRHPGGVQGDFCPACAESILDAAESERVMREMLAPAKQVMLIRDS